VPIIIENVVLGSGGGSIPVTQQIDRVYENPT
jgi:carbamate kinase